MSNKTEWGFPELNPLENAEITKARENGYAEFYPCVKGPDVQATMTLMGARKFNEKDSKKLCRNRARRERDQSMRDLGLKKVRGNLGGTYWE